MISRFLFLFVFCPAFIFAQDVVHWSDGVLKLDNGFINRKIRVSDSAVYSTSLTLADSDRNYIEPGREFSFRINGRQADGRSGWICAGLEDIAGDRSGQGVRLMLEGTGPADGVWLEINYLLYPELPVVRKWLRIENSGGRDIRIEALNVEDLEIALNYVHSVVYHNYGRMKHLESFPDLCERHPGQGSTAWSF